MTEKKPARESSRTKLLKAAGELMRESGYAAVTSRQVAKRAGLKPQLVHYYFASMDDLFVALYREFADDLVEQQQAILNAPNPLREMWEVTSEARGALLTEFLALANHRKVIQAEITEFGHRFRRGQIEIMERLLEAKGREAFPWSPALAALLLNSLARSLAVESDFDITEGHEEARAAVETFISRFDPPAVESERGR